MSVHIQKELEKLKKKCLGLCAKVEENVQLAVKAFTEKDRNLAKQVIDIDLEIDQMEIEVEEDCLKILALYQPVAIDLRFIICTLKLNNDLERIGDLAVNIAQQVSFMLSEVNKQIIIPFDYKKMSVIVKDMLKDSIDSLVQLDIEKAKKVCISDDAVDNMHAQMYGLLEDAIKRHPDSVEYVIHYLSVSKSLERIADHATNIAEDVIYMINGNIVRHGNSF
ncbi:phosphate signaling complex protein PhoU [bacterium]|nr:phosphate signaling complex protein PhoU [bacterium]